MRRKTQAKPHTFSHDKENFKTTKFGFLEGNELLLKYMPKLLKIFKQVKSDKSEKQIKEELESKEMSIDISAILSEIGQNTLTKLAYDLFSQTYLEEDGKWSVIDPESFESHKELFAVATEVFTFNYPDFFKGDKDTEGTQVSQKLITVPSTHQKKMSSKPEILKL